MAGAAVVVDSSGGPYEVSTTKHCTDLSNACHSAKNHWRLASGCIEAAPGSLAVASAIRLFAATARHASVANERFQRVSESPRTKTTEAKICFFFRFKTLCRLYSMVSLSKRLRSRARGCCCASADESALDAGRQVSLSDKMGQILSAYR